MFYEEGFADEDALNSAILQLVGEVEELSQDVERLQASWQETFANSPTMNPAGQASGHYGDFIWEALTTTVDHDDILPFLAELVDESPAHPNPEQQSEEISEQDFGRVDLDDVAPTLEEAAGDSRASSVKTLQQVFERYEPTDQGNEAQLGLQPEEGASSINDGVSPGQFDDCLDRAILRLRNRLLNEQGTGVWFCPPNPPSIEVEDETRPESEGAASSINTASTRPTYDLPSEPYRRAIGRVRTYLRGKRTCIRIQGRGIAEEDEDPQSEGVRRVDERNECPEAPQRLSDEDAAGNRGIDHEHGDAISQQTPNEGSPHDSDMDQNTAGLWIERPEPHSATTRTPSFISRIRLRRSNSSPQLHEMSTNSSLPEESISKDVTRRQSVNQMRPWLESNASALIGTSHTAQAYSHNFTQLTIPDKSVHMQAQFCEVIDSVCEDIKEIGRINSAANKHLVDALRCLTQAKCEIRKAVFRPREDVASGSLTPKSNQRAQNRMRNNAIVTGVPKVANENVLEIVKRIGYCIGSPIDDMYIKDAYRIYETDTSSPILVKFTNSVIKDTLIKASRKSELYANQLLGIHGEEQSRVSIEDQLTPFNINLLEKAKVLKDNGCIDLWVEKGTIWLKKRGSIIALELDSIAGLRVLFREFKLPY